MASFKGPIVTLLRKVPSSKIEYLNIEPLRVVSEIDVKKNPPATASQRNAVTNGLTKEFLAIDKDLVKMLMDVEKSIAKLIEAGEKKGPHEHAKAIEQAKKKGAETNRRVVEFIRGKEKKVQKLLERLFDSHKELKSLKETYQITLNAKGAKKTVSLDIDQPEGTEQVDTSKLSKNATNFEKLAVNIIKEAEEEDTGRGRLYREFAALAKSYIGETEKNMSTTDDAEFKNVRARAAKSMKELVDVQRKKQELCLKAMSENQGAMEKEYKVLEKTFAKLPQKAAKVVAQCKGANARLHKGIDQYHKVLKREIIWTKNLGDVCILIKTSAEIERHRKAFRNTLFTSRSTKREAKAIVELAKKVGNAINEVKKGL